MKSEGAGKGDSPRPVDKAKYEKFYDKFYNRNNKDRREPLVIDYHIEHSIGRKGFQELWDFYYKKIKK